MQQIEAQQGNVLLDTATLTIFTSVYIPDTSERPETLIELTEAEAEAYVAEHQTAEEDATEGLKTALEVAKEIKTSAITDYDKSEAVNSFTISGVSLWLTKSERAELRGLIEAKERAGETTVSKLLGETEVSIPLSTATSMLDAILIYADKCQRQTAKHLLQVAELTEVESVEAYDHTAGYPEKLSFSLG